MPRGIVTHVIDRLLVEETAVSTTEVARAAGISRQAAHKTLRTLVRSGALEVHGRARASRYQRASLPANTRCVRLEVASAGSLYRLSARLLFDEVTAGDVTLDFTGVIEVGDEFLEEVFSVWAGAHPTVRLHVINVPACIEAVVYAAAGRRQAN